jgi:hypothetical protein
MKKERSPLAAFLFGLKNVGHPVLNSIDLIEDFLHAWWDTHRLKSFGFFA